jgi:hypothetical protein
VVLVVLTTFERLVTFFFLWREGGFANLAGGTLGGSALALVVGLGGGGDGLRLGGFLLEICNASGGAGGLIGRSHFADVFVCKEWRGVGNRDISKKKLVVGSRKRLVFDCDDEEAALEHSWWVYSCWRMVRFNSPRGHLNCH